MKRPWVALILGMCCLLLLGFAPPVQRVLHAKRFLTGLAEPTSSTQAVLIESELSIPSGTQAFRARVYRPANGARAPGVVVAHGVHYRGIDEKRLVPFVRELARSGFVVITPELSELADYRLTRGSVDRIRDAALYLSNQRQWVRDERVGLIGFSFAGGLSLVAASEPALADRLSYVTSVGGHHDLPRVLSFLLNDEIVTPTGLVHAKAHDYGLAVVLYGNLKEFVPATELARAEAAFRAWLQEDRARAKQLAESFAPGSESARLFELLVNQKLQTLAPQLNALLERDRLALSALSPNGKLRRVHAPVYLLHGAHDSVIPASEVSFAELELGSAAHAALISPLIEHVEVGKSASFIDKLSLVAFMAHLF
ncbi:MAG: dienelactone hydrolase family protein [Myxococcota bacterium]